jgi:hypothetical protein
MAEDGWELAGDWQIGSGPVGEGGGFVAAVGHPTATGGYCSQLLLGRSCGQVGRG